MLKINRIRFTDDEMLEMSAISDKGEEHKFELLTADLPMLIQMLLTAKQEKDARDSKKQGHEPTLLLNFVEGWQVFDLPDEMPEGLGLHFQCAGGFEFAFAITNEDEGRTSKEFFNDMSSLMNGVKQ